MIEWVETAGGEEPNPEATANAAPRAKFGLEPGGIERLEVGEHREQVAAPVGLVEPDEFAGGIGEVDQPPIGEGDLAECSIELGIGAPTLLDDVGDDGDERGGDGGIEEDVGPGWDGRRGA